jgi:hypothetical protein
MQTEWSIKDVVIDGKRYPWSQAVGILKAEKRQLSRLVDAAQQFIESVSAINAVSGRIEPQFLPARAAARKLIEEAKEAVVSHLPKRLSDFDDHGKLKISIEKVRDEIVSLDKEEGRLFQEHVLRNMHNTLRMILQLSHDVYEAVPSNITAK